MARFGRCVVALACVALTLTVVDPGARAQQPDALDRGAVGLGLALRRVGTSARVLCVTAHPDDEHNGVLARLSRGQGVRTGLFTLTRGEGGQNAIGPELFQALGVLRSAELESLHAYDGAEQLFGLAYDFGLSFSVEETLARWGHQPALGDVVRAIRAFRPDVVLTLPLEGTGGGQHHQATGRLAAEAFRAAADPLRFPEQLQERGGLRPWQTRKIYVGGVGGGDQDLPAGARVELATGVYDPLLGMTWQQLGSRARSLHRCQMVGQLLAEPGPASGVYVLLDAVEKPLAPESDILEGVDTTLAGLARFAPALAPALGEAQRLALAARQSFDPRAPEATVQPLAVALAAVQALERELGARVADLAAQAELAERLAEERRDLEEALWRAQGLQLELRSSDGVVVPGQAFEITARLWNLGARPVELDELALELEPGWSAETRDGAPGPLPAGGSRTLRFTVRVAEHARPSQPHWRRRPVLDRNELVFEVDPLQPFAPPPVSARARLRLGEVTLTRSAPAVTRYEGPQVGGEKRHPIQVAPALVLRVAPELAPVPLSAARRPLELRVFVRNEAPGPGLAELRLELPDGWSARPPRAPLRFGYEGEELAVRFELRPPPVVRPGTELVRAVASRDGREYRDGVQVVEYPHVERRQLLRPAEARLLCLDVRTAPGVSVGYVMGSGDAVAEAIVRLGVPLTLLSADDLAFGDLSHFTTILTGIRAYESRPDLRSAHGRLLSWVESGGHLVVQYNRASFNRLSPSAGSSEGPSPFAPFPARVSSERVSDEGAAMHVLAPQHPLLTTPNLIGAGDWAGWVQERGIQLLEAQDPRYRELLASSDPFAYNAGEKRGLLVEAPVGRGSWTYVGLVLFRQIPAGVPGGWRLLANLVSRPRPKPTRSLQQRTPPVGGP
jgi:LmbE family N-acetylglucosaminyl deacetylase